MDLVLVMRQRLRDQTSEVRSVQRFFVALTTTATVLLALAFVLLFPTPQQHSSLSPFGPADDTAALSSRSIIPKWTFYLVLLISDALLVVALCITGRAARSVRVISGGSSGGGAASQLSGGGGSNQLGLSSSCGGGATPTSSTNSLSLSGAPWSLGDVPMPFTVAAVAAPILTAVLIDGRIIVAVIIVGQLASYALKCHAFLTIVFRSENSRSSSFGV